MARSKADRIINALLDTLERLRGSDTFTDQILDDIHDYLTDEGAPWFEAEEEDEDEA